MDDLWVRNVLDTLPNLFRPALSKCAKTAPCAGCLDFSIFGLLGAWAQEFSPPVVIFAWAKVRIRIGVNTCQKAVSIRRREVCTV